MTRIIGILTNVSKLGDNISEHFGHYNLSLFWFQ